MTNKIIAAIKNIIAIIKDQKANYMKRLLTALKKSRSNYM
jgi:hypothetical protein